MGFWGIAAIWPWIESWLLKDKREHHILDRPRNAPTRTALGVAAVVWYAVMWAGASGDLVAVFFHMSLNDMIYIFRVLFIVGPFIAFFLTRRICINKTQLNQGAIAAGVSPQMGDASLIFRVNVAGTVNITRSYCAAPARATCS